MIFAVVIFAKNIENILPYSSSQRNCDNQGDGWGRGGTRGEEEGAEHCDAMATVSEIHSAALMEDLALSEPERCNIRQ